VEPQLEEFQVESENPGTKWTSTRRLYYNSLGKN
jgi:hypothetical protein